MITVEDFHALDSCFYRCSPRLLSSNPPQIGTQVIIGSADPKTWKIATVDKIDKRGVITTTTTDELQVRFSTKYTQILSTQKQNDHYWGMYDFQKTYERSLKRKQEFEHDNDTRRIALIARKVAVLDPVYDRNLIDEIERLLG